MRIASLVALLLAFPRLSRAQPFDPNQVVYAVSNVHEALWTFDRTDPQPTADSTSYEYGAMTVAIDPLTNHLFTRAGGASATEGSNFVTCVDASTLEFLG